MKYLISIPLLALLFLQTGCIFAPAPGNFSAGPGFVTNTKEGFQGNNNQKIEKVGKSCITNYGHLVAFGDASIEEAKLKGDIKNINSLDKEYNGLGLWILGFPLFVYEQSCLVARGN
jgi:hypothetical protein